jgi:hypothetical protein
LTNIEASFDNTSEYPKRHHFATIPSGYVKVTEKDEGQTNQRAPKNARKWGERDRVDGGEMLRIMVTLVSPLAMSNGASRLKPIEFAEVVGTRPKAEIQHRSACQGEHPYPFKDNIRNDE